MIGHRHAWMAARARNAARKGVWIALLGGVAAVAMLIALELVPRQLERQLRRRVAELPVATDSTPIMRRLDSLHGDLRALEVARLRALPRDTAARIDSTRRDSARATVAAESTLAAGGFRTKPDSAAIDLMARVTRARNAPLPESYRALAESPLMKGEPRVRVLIDSIELVDREREAHAALAGPGARYAALTARLTTLGLGLVRLAEQRLARAVLSSIAAMRTTPISGADSAQGNTLIDSAALAERDAFRTAERMARRDSLLRHVAQEESALVSARRISATREARRTALEQRLRIDIPPLAMLLAALVIGVAFGYGMALLREIHRPTVGDVSELERLTAAPVVLHSRDTAAARAERRERRDLPRIIDRESDTFVVLHLALSGVGDIAERVDVLAADPVVAAAVALGTAAAASRESRAVLVVEQAGRSPVLARLLRVKSRSGSSLSADGNATAANPVHVVTLDPDTQIHVQCAGRDPFPHGRSTEPALPGAEQYDLRLNLLELEDEVSPVAPDVILCVRQCATPLAWLARATRQARHRQQRVRAVVLWSRNVPTGS
ncbi:MAG: hypothetical protein IPP90_09070 [Gemmatimonadaceae bacterium]|nr:hypothetical protein [Gemmatimonadaceae bacterium]